MTRSNAREVAVQLIYEIDYTGEDPAQAIETRMDRSYYSGLSAETGMPDGFARCAKPLLGTAHGRKFPGSP